MMVIFKILAKATKKYRESQIFEVQQARPCLIMDKVTLYLYCLQLMCMVGLGLFCGNHD